MFDPQESSAAGGRRLPEAELLGQSGRRTLNVV